MGASSTGRGWTGPGRARRLVAAVLIGIALALLLAPTSARRPRAAAKVSLPEGARVQLRDAARALRARGASLSRVDSHRVVVQYTGGASPRPLQRIAGEAGTAAADALLAGAVTRARRTVDEARAAVGRADAALADQRARSGVQDAAAAHDVAQGELGALQAERAALGTPGSLVSAQDLESAIAQAQERAFDLGVSATRQTELVANLRAAEAAQLAATDALTRAETHARVGAGVVATVDTGSRGRGTPLRWLALPALAAAVLVFVGVPGSGRRRRRVVDAVAAPPDPVASIPIVRWAGVSPPAPPLDERARPAVEQILDLAELERQLAELEARAAARAEEDRVRARAAELMDAQPMHTPPGARRNPVAPRRPRRRHHRKE